MPVDNRTTLGRQWRKYLRGPKMKQEQQQPMPQPMPQQMPQVQFLPLAPSLLALAPPFDPPQTHQYRGTQDLARHHSYRIDCPPLRRRALPHPVPSVCHRC